MTAYSYETFCRAVAEIHGHACWVRRVVTQRPLAIPTSWERCGGQMDGHHLIPKRVLKREFPREALWCHTRATVDERRPPVQTEARWRPWDSRNDTCYIPDPSRLCGLGDLLNDGRNGVPTCRHHHDLIENAVIKLRREELPQQTEQFAAEIGLGWYLDRSYGPLASVPVLSTCDGCGPPGEVRVYGPEIHYCDGCAPYEESETR